MQNVALDCHKCGGRLEITEDIDRFHCPYCGTEYLVERDHGTLEVYRLEQRVDVVEKRQTSYRLQTLHNEITSGIAALIADYQENDDRLKQRADKGTDYSAINFTKERMLLERVKNLSTSIEEYRRLDGDDLTILGYFDPYPLLKVMIALFGSAQLAFSQTGTKFRADASIQNAFTVDTDKRLITVLSTDNDDRQRFATEVEKILQVNYPAFTLGTSNHWQTQYGVVIIAIIVVVMFFGVLACSLFMQL